MAELALKIDPRPAVDSAGQVRAGLDSLANSADRAEKALESAGKATESIQRGKRVVQRSASDMENALKGVGTSAGQMGRVANDNMQSLQRQMVAAAGGAGRLSTAFSSMKTSALGFASAATVAARALAPLMALMGGAAVVSGVVRTSTEFESLGASLKTVTGSAANADRAFAFISQFASETPYSLQQVTEAFIRLQSLGLDPSRKALESYGNTASAMGKPIMQFVEAVADAMTGEFERLKEFGIRASQDGERVSLTFQGVTKTIGNNAREIEAYLQEIGRVQFGGAMNDQMATLTGVFSGAQDEIAKFQNAIGEGGVSGAIKRVVTSFTEMLKANEDLALSIGAFAGGAIDLYADGWDTTSAALSEAWRWTQALAEVASALAPSMEGAGQQISSVGAGIVAAAEAFASAWAAAGQAILAVLNVVIGAGVGAYQSVIATWDQLPAAFSSLAKSAANMLVSGLEAGVNGALAGVNDVINAINSIAPEFAQIPTVPGIDLSDYKQSLTEAESATSETVGAIMAAATSTDYLGGAFDALTAPIAAAGSQIADAKGRIDEAATATQTLTETAKLSGEGFQIMTDGANATGAATADAGKKAEKATASFEAQRRSVGEAASEIQRQIDMFDASEGATARLEFRTREMARAWDIAREAGLNAIPAETLRAIEDAAGQIETLTNKLQAMRTVRSAVDEFFPFEKAAREAGELQTILDDASLSLSNTERAALQMRIDKGFVDAAEAAERLRTGGKKAAEDIGQSFIENVGNTFADIFASATRDGESFFASILRGFAGLGSQLAAAGAKNLLGQALGIDFGDKAKSAAGIGGLIGHGAGFGGSSGSGVPSAPSYGYASATSASSFRALNDNLTKTSRSALDVARQFEGLNERADTGVLDTFLQASGNWKGLSARDTAWCAAFANAAIMQAGGQGTGSNLASSFLNWGQGTTQPKVGDVVVLRPQSRGASGHVGFVAGFGDGTVQIFGGNQSNAANTRSYSTREVVGYRTGAGTGVAANQNVPGRSDSIYGTSAREYQRITARGVQDGLRSYGGPAPSPTAQQAMANGFDGVVPQRTPFGQTAMGVVGAGLGIFGQGYQSGSPLMGGVSGALGGFQAGSALFPALGAAGPIGAVAGAALGILGGVFGKRAEREKQHREAQAAWEQARPQYEEFKRSLTGETTGQLRQFIEGSMSQLQGFMKVGGKAWKYGEGNSTAEFFSTGQMIWKEFHKRIDEYRAGFESLNETMRRGGTSQSEYAKGLSAAKEMKAQIDAFLDDTAIAWMKADFTFGANDSALETEKAHEEMRNAALEKARASSVEYALAMLYTADTMSEVEKTIDGLRGAALGVSGILQDLGLTAEETGRRVEERLVEALRDVAKGLEQGVSDRIADLAGVGYTVSIRQFLEEYETLQKDFKAAGADTSQLPDLFRRQLQAIVDGSELTGTAFTDLIAQFPALAGVVREFTETAVAASATEIRDAIKGYQERLFQAQNAGDELALFDRRAAQERIDAARFGADALAALEAALGAERANIATQAAEQMQTAYRSFLDSRLSEATSARAEAESALRAEYERTVSFVSGLKGFLDSIAINRDTSTLDNAGRLAEAAKQYRETLALAQGGDQEAQDRLVSSSEAYLREARDYYATSEGYGAVYDEINATLKTTMAKAETELEVARRQASFLSEIAEGTRGLGGLLKEYLEAVQKQLETQKLVDGNRYFGINPERNRLIDAGLRQSGLTYTGNYGIQADGSNPLDVWFKSLSPAQQAIANGVIHQYIGINRAQGGLITGPGTATSDSIRVNASNGEFMMREAAVRGIGVPAMDFMNRTGRLPEIAATRMPAFVNDNRAIVAAIERLERTSVQNAKALGELQTALAQEDRRERRDQSAETERRRESSNRLAARRSQAAA